MNRTSLRQWMSRLGIFYLKWRFVPVQLGIVATVFLIPVWYRFVGAPASFSPDYVTGFLIFRVMVFTLIAWVVMGLPGLNTFRRDPRRVVWGIALAALGVWAYASSGWALVRVNHPGVAQNGALQLGVMVLFVLMMACASPRAEVLVGVLVVDLVWSGLIGGLQVAEQGSIGLSMLGEFRLGLHQPGISIVEAGDLRWLRPYGLLPHPNMLGAVLAIGLLACVVLLVSNYRWVRWLGTGIFLFGMWNFWLTFSRGAWIGFAAGLFVMYPLLRRPFGGNRGGTARTQNLLKNPTARHLLVTVALTVIAGVVFFVLYRPFLSARAGLSDETVEQRSISDRVIYADYAYQAIAQPQYRWIGLGISNFPWYSARQLVKTSYALQGDNVHEVLLSAMAELGMVGYGLVVIALFAGVEAVLRHFRTTTTAADTAGKSEARAVVDSQRMARAALFAGFIMLTLVGLLDHYPWTILQFQTAWWGLLAAALAPGSRNPSMPVQKLEVLSPVGEGT